ncbi:hypothetical protein HYALB_00011413 [Hymenoscyphus albidus]|uniref:Chromatin structure-remodeling complex subunit rsc9 n=1 Tax=Hymenoscyphus albidus TaxID=595503 RepID=A0A9N9LEE3_9HELO|nr:hypothetical protein HYALB_00011413 [Hymenoscyphus albidus]
MAPPPQDDSSIEYTPEYHGFISKLTEYHEKRGTEFVREPRVGSRQIDLLKLYKTVMVHGGYDKVSDEKLAWRKLGEKFQLGSMQLPALAFALKTVYYKNLAAYEISTVHGKEPPPKEILEYQTASGGSLLTRTTENYKPRRDANAGNEQSEASGDDGTPARDRNGSEETPGSGSRATRGLRQAPPQRILFQPESHTPRQTRHLSNTSHASSPQHSTQNQAGPRGASTSFNPSSNTDSMSHAVASYEPRPPMPLTLRPVTTPANNPVGFAQLQRAKEARLAAANRPPSNFANRGLMLPGSGFDGPNIYVRCLCALKSGIASEQDYALHHLVKISMERGDKYRFESFPGLAEALTEKLLEVGSLFYQVNWEVSYIEDGATSSLNVLNGIDGTPDILHRIAQLPKLDVDDNIQTEQFSDALLQVNEAALTMRNMIMLEENAQYVSDMSPLRDWLSIALNLPDFDSVVELKHYALDIAEQITKYLHFDQTDPLYVSLLAQIISPDRGAILTALRAISRISMNLEENNMLRGVPVTVMQYIMDWILLNDEDLVHACLDFLYQYTAVVDNVDFLLSEVQVEPLVNQLTRLLSHGAKDVVKDMIRVPERRKPAPENLAPVPGDLLAKLLTMDEPERSSQWLRCLYEEDREECITQIALWTAYQNQFASTVHLTGKPILQAADFIKNVSTTFAEKAAAQVQSGDNPRFVIKGIRMRSLPVNLDGEEYVQCLWNVHRPGAPAGACGEYFNNKSDVFYHILQAHLYVEKTADGKYQPSRTDKLACYWGECSGFQHSPADKFSQLVTHIKFHFKSPSPSNNITDGQPPAKKTKPSYVIPAVKQGFHWYLTAMDERHDAAGIPLSAVLVLRNLARNISKTEAEEIHTRETGVSWVDRLFKPVVPTFYEVMAHNRALVSLIF